MKQILIVVGILVSHSALAQHKPELDFDLGHEGDAPVVHALISRPISRPLNEDDWKLECKSLFVQPDLSSECHPAPEGELEEGANGAPLEHRNLR